MAREDFTYESARLRALGDFTKAFVVPVAVLVSLVKATEVQLGHYTVPCYGLSIFLNSYLRMLYCDFQRRRDVKKLAMGKEGSLGSIPV